VIFQGSRGVWNYAGHKGVVSDFLWNTFYRFSEGSDRVTG